MTIDSQTTPKTRIELENWMKANCYHFNSYSINGNFIYEGFGIDYINGFYNWYYTERGQKRGEKCFQDGRGNNTVCI
jgi:hypothetical protein